MDLAFWRWRSAREDPLVFLHMPKCAGTSLVRSISAAAEVKTVLHGMDRTLFGSFDDFESIKRGRDHIYLCGLPKGSFDLVHGHFSLSTAMTAYPNGRYITVLREPRTRLVSSFLFNHSLSERKLSKLGTYADLILRGRGTLQSFLTLRDLAPLTDNVYARFLLSPHKEIPSSDFIREGSFERLYCDAVEKLRLFQFVGLLENPDLLKDLGNFLGNDLRPMMLNVTQETDTRSCPDIKSQLSQLQSGCLSRLSHLDLRLWNHIASSATTWKSGAPSAGALFDGYIDSRRRGD
jgi:hypothetical protein